MTETRTIRGLLFDKDGTLLDFEATWGPATLAVLGALAEGDRAMVARLAASCGFDPDALSFGEDSPVIAGETDAFAPAWARLMGRDYDRAFAARVDALYREESLKSLSAFPEIRAALIRFRDDGLRLGLATNDSEGTARAHLDAMGIADLFDFVCGYDSGHGAKPAAGMVTAFATAIGAAPEEVAMIGDSAHDIEAARAAGARAVGIARNETARRALAPVAGQIVTDLDELAAVLDEIVLPRG